MEDDGLRRLAELYHQTVLEKEDAVRRLTAEKAIFEEALELVEDGRRDEVSPQVLGQFDDIPRRLDVTQHAARRLGDVLELTRDHHGYPASLEVAAELAELAAATLNTTAALVRLRDAIEQ